MKRYILIFLFTFLSCEDHVNPIPSLRVNLTLDLTFEDKELKAIPSYKEFSINDVNLAQRESVGFGGVLVVHNMTGEYKAYDRACPYESNSNTTVVVDNAVLYAECPVCGTKYNLWSSDGAPDGVSKHGLRRYNITQSGNKLIVSN
jgi:nitrite reductase/ring-hydroxylating ferredoxin subunit